MHSGDETTYSRSYFYCYTSLPNST